MKGIIVKIIMNIFEKRREKVLLLDIPDKEKIEYIYLNVPFSDSLKILDKANSFSFKMTNNKQYSNNTNKLNDFYFYYLLYAFIHLVKLRIKKLVFSV